MIAKLYSCIHAVVLDIYFKKPFGENVIVYKLPHWWVFTPRVFPTGTHPTVHIEKDILSEDRYENEPAIILP